MSELCGFVYNKGHQKSRETTREIWRSEGELIYDTDRNHYTAVNDYEGISMTKFNNPKAKRVK